MEQLINALKKDYKDTPILSKLNTFQDLEIFFDKLNLEKNHFLNSNDECTPMGCVKEMVDKIPNEFWKKNNLKVLDSCAGNGNFHAYIQTKTSLDNLYFNEINKTRVKNMKNIFGDNINLTVKDFLKFEEKEQWDLVVSNPPYALFDENNKRTSKNHNLSRKFIEKSIKITKPNGYILFIVPNNWMSYADRNILPDLMSKYQFRYLDIHGAKKWFPKVGSSFTWFLLQKKENNEKFIVKNNYHLKTTEYVKLDKKSKFIPLFYSEEVRTILNKTIYSDYEKYNVETTSDLHAYTKKDLLSKTKDDTFKYEIIHTPSQTLWSKRPHKFQKGYKVFIPLSNQYKPYIKKDVGMTQSIAFIRCKSYKEAKQIQKKLQDELYKFLANITRFGNFNNVRILQNFIKYDKIKLNKKEKDIIQIFNNKYYGKDK